MSVYIQEALRKSFYIEVLEMHALPFSESSSPLSKSLAHEMNAPPTNQERVKS